MEQITRIAQSLSPYVIIKVIGDPIKTEYASHWGKKSSMPHVWVKRFNEQERPIIVNIWDLPQSRDKSSSMIPNNKIDHFIIVYDPYYRSLFQSKNKYFISLETLIEECPGPFTVIIHGNGTIPLNIPRHINLITKKTPADTAGLVRDISTRVYANRVAHIDKQISELLLKN